MSDLLVLLNQLLVQSLVLLDDSLRGDGRGVGGGEVSVAEEVFVRVRDLSICQNDLLLICDLLLQ